MAELTPLDILSVYALPTMPTSVESLSGFRCDTLETLEKTLLSKRVRRIGRNTKLALLGAIGCIQGTETSLDPDSLGVFLGTAFGSASELLLISQQLSPTLDKFPSPIHFSNTVSNSSTFTIARALQAKGCNLTVCQEEFSFEGACLAASMELHAHNVTTALVGGCDENIIRHEQWLAQVDYPRDVEFGEGSAWCLLGHQPDEAIGQLLHVGFAGSRNTTWAEEIAALVTIHQTDPLPLTLVPGLRCSQEDLDALERVLPNSHRRDYLKSTGWYPTAAATGLTKLLIEATEPGLFLHLSQSAFGHKALLLIRITTEHIARQKRTPPHNGTLVS